MPFKDPEKEREWNRKYYAENKEKFKQWKDKWRATHKEQIAQKSKEYYQTHREVAYKASQTYRSKEENREKERAAALKYYYDNWEKIRERRNHRPTPEKLRLSLKSSDYSRMRRYALLNELGGKCVVCGFDDKRALQLDHIEGNGKRDFKRFNDSAQMLVYYYLEHLDEAKTTLQVLCANHNWIKRAEKKEYLTMQKRSGV